jgi:putative ubiquitin-RnfH superfamily antitoxin RatB of RatAB toxin-antitoxin module
MAPADAPAWLAVEVFYCPQPGQADRVPLQLPHGSSLLLALQASGLLERHALPSASLRAGVWGREKPLQTLLRDRDRVEIYRPLLVDPKEARRQRYSQHKARQASTRQQPSKQRAGAGAALPAGD